MIDTIVERLKSYALEFKEKKKLNKNDTVESEKILRECLLRVHDFDQTFVAMSNLPVHIVQTSFIRAWNEADQDRRAIVIKALKASPILDTAHGMRRKLAIAGRILNVSPNDGIQLLGDIALHLTKNKPGKASKVALQYVSEYVVPALLVNLKDESISSNLSDKALDALEILTVETMSSNERFGQDEINYTLLFFSRCKGIRSGEVSTAVCRSISATPNAQVVELPEIKKPESSSQLRESKGGMQYLEGLREYIEKIEKKLEDLINAEKIAANKYENERHLRNISEDKYREIDKKLSEVSRQREYLTELLDGVRKENKVLMQQIDAEKEKSEIQKREILESAGKETNYLVDELRNKLAGALKIEYVDFQEIISEPMTEDLGENLRSQLRNVFRILGSNGIRF